jgi:predicted HTH domain antitoxin
LASEPAQHGLHGDCFKTWFRIEKLDDFKDLMAKESGSPRKDGAFSSINSSFFHGKFRKYSAELGPHSYILKVQMPEHPELPATEYLCNQIAEVLMIKVPDFFLITYNGLPTFVTRNFIEKTKISNLVHIFHYLADVDKKSFGCEAICKAIERETGRIQEIERFLELCLFDSLIGNNDRHGRNLAIVETVEKKSLALFYDNPSYLGIEIENFLEADHKPGGTVATSTSVTGSSTMQDYMQEIKRLGFSYVIEAFAVKVESHMKKIISLIELSRISEKRKQAIINLIRKRNVELQKT